MVLLQVSGRRPLCLVLRVASFFFDQTMAFEKLPRDFSEVVDGLPRSTAQKFSADFREVPLFDFREGRSCRFLGKYGMP